MSGLLNPAVQASVCVQMIKAVDDALGQVERGLTATLLTHDQYLQSFGKAEALRRLSKDLRLIYDQNFNV